MSEKFDPFERALQLWAVLPSSVQVDGESHTLAFLIREKDWRPLSAPWWRGKEVYVIGGDVDGNFFLRHCDGTVRLWDHRKQSDTIIAKSVRDFGVMINDV
jgi:hypothetical protein